MQNFKNYVNGRSAEIQKKLSELGYDIEVSSKNENLPFIHVEGNEVFYGNNMRAFSSCPLPELTVEEILEMKPEPKFKPFDKVLVRDYDREDWYPDFFMLYDVYSFKYKTMSEYYRQCIPYKGNEHLAFTSDEPK